MQWQGRRESDNVEDRRRMGAPAMIAGGGGIATLIIILLVVVMGGDPSQLMQGGGPAGQLGSPQQAQVDQTQFSPEEQELASFVKVVLADTEDVWNELFPAAFGKPYVEPKLVLFSGRVQSACGLASAASGPFYCPEDSKVYIDLSFYRELKQRFRAPGDFAQAYVIAHEVGHHVQKLLGLTDRVHQMHGRVSQEEYNQLSVRLELQADFLAGVWAHHAQKKKRILDPGDIEEALRCASAIGDDSIQQQTQGYVRPDSFTHGSSEQRVRWFRKGFETGDLRQMDTFNSPDL